MASGSAITLKAERPPIVGESVANWDGERLGSAPARVEAEAEALEPPRRYEDESVAAFNQRQLKKFEERHTRLITRLSMSAPGDTQALGEYARTLAGGSGLGPTSNDFVVNRLTLQKAMADFGLRASTPEVEAFIKDTLFWQDSGFNVVAYDDFVKVEMGALGATVKKGVLERLVHRVVAGEHDPVRHRLHTPKHLPECRPAVWLGLRSHRK